VSVTAELCRFPLPTGQYCRQIALKGEYLCRHHRRLLDKTQAETARQEAMEQLAERLASLDLPDLLEALYGKLARIHPAFRACPEAKLALIITLERLRAMPEDSATSRIPPRSNPINFSENQMKSMNYSGPASQKTL
jgi:hypothetical protein